MTDEPSPPAAAGHRETLTVARLLATATGRLRAGGIGNARRDARVLLAHASGLEETTIVARPDSAVCPAMAEAVGRLVERRIGGEPLSRVLGRREFWSMDFRLSRETLDPRPDSETLIEVLLGHVPDRGLPLRILDLGTGTGCLLLSLLSELPRALGVGVDLSHDACATASANAERLGFADRAIFAVADWGAASPAGGFDLVVSNPPYVSRGEMSALDEHVREFDPHLALCGGDDGLDAYREIAQLLGRLLAPGGLAAVEFGAGQAAEVSAIFARADLCVRSVHRDLAGHERCLLLEKGNRSLPAEKGF